MYLIKANPSAQSHENLNDLHIYMIFFWFCLELNRIEGNMIIVEIQFVFHIQCHNILVMHTINASIN